MEAEEQEAVGIFLPQQQKGEDVGLGGIGSRGSRAIQKNLHRS